VQMLDDKRDTLTSNCSTLKQLFMTFYGKIKQHIFHTLRFLHFGDNRNKRQIRIMTDCGWKMRTVFPKLNDSCYSPTEHLAADKIIVLFTGRVIFKQ